LKPHRFSVLIDLVAWVEMDSMHPLRLITAFTKVIALVAALGLMLACAGVSPATTEPRPGEAARFNLARCETLEPSLYRCPGLEEPLCDPDFERSTVRCVKITRGGVLLQPLPDVQ
jgi:hypothetical protein